MRLSSEFLFTTRKLEFLFTTRTGTLILYAQITDRYVTMGITIMMDIQGFRGIFQLLPAKRALALLSVSCTSSFHRRSCLGLFLETYLYYSSRRPFPGRKSFFRVRLRLPEKQTSLDLYGFILKPTARHQSASTVRAFCTRSHKSFQTNSHQFTSWIFAYLFGGGNSNLVFATKISGKRKNKWKNI